MPHYNDDVPSKLSQEEVFDYMADFTNAEKWDPGTKSSKQLDSGKIGVGAQFELMVEFNGNVSPFTYRITEYERPTRVVVEAETDSVKLVDTMTTTADGEGSVLKYDARMDLKGLVKLTTPIMAIIFNRLCEKGQERPGARAEPLARAGPDGAIANAD